MNFFTKFVTNEMLLARVFAMNIVKFVKYKLCVWQMVQEILVIFIKVLNAFITVYILQYEHIYKHSFFPVSSHPTELPIEIYPISSGMQHHNQYF